MSSFAELEVKCETIEFNSNPMGQWEEKVPYRQLLTCKSITALAKAPESADETEIPYPFAFRRVVCLKVVEFLAHYSQNPKEFDDVKKVLGWETVGDKKVPVPVSKEYNAYYADFIDIPMSHPDYGYNGTSTEVSWENTKGVKFVWNNLPVVEAASIKCAPTEENKKGVTMFCPRDEDPVTILDLLSAANTLQCKPLFKLVVAKMGEVLKGLTFTGQMELFKLASVWFEDHKKNLFFNYKEMKGYQAKYMPDKSSSASATSSSGGSAVAAGGGN